MGRSERDEIRRFQSLGFRCQVRSEEGGAVRVGLIGRAREAIPRGPIGNSRRAAKARTNSTASLRAERAGAVERIDSVALRRARFSGGGGFADRFGGGGFAGGGFRGRR